MQKVLVAMSGGVDSSVAAAVLLEQGYEVVGATMLLSENEADARDAKNTCDILRVPHVTLDRRKEFEEYVKSPFAKSYAVGETPNPCIVCNKKIKFGTFLDYAEENGFDLIATGHYVQKSFFNGVPVIKCADDKKKDQSYVLWQLSEHQISRAIFPLCGMTKSEARSVAERYGFVSAHKSDSQDICFVPDGDYAGYIEKNHGIIPISGNFTDTEGNIIGQHSGIINYTVGQRKGLGIAFGEPRYVVAKNPENNTVTLGRNEDLFTTYVKVREVNVSRAFEFPGSFEVKIRYGHSAQPATVTLGENGSAEITFTEPQRAPAPGQSAVIYSGDLLVGGGIIE